MAKTQNIERASRQSVFVGSCVAICESCVSWPPPWGIDVVVVLDSVVGLIKSKIHLLPTLAV